MFLSNRGSFRPETSGAYTLRRRGRRRPKSGSAIGACAVARLAGSGGPIGDYYGSANTFRVDGNSSRGYRFVREVVSRRRGRPVSEKVVRRLMRGLGLRVCYARRGRYSSYAGEIDAPAPNLLLRADGTHDFSAGKLTTTDALYEMCMENPLCSGVTFSGGEPFCQPEALYELGSRFKAAGKHLMCYSGWTFEELLKKSGSEEYVGKLLSILDVLVDGRFDISKRSLSLLFRGSSNQRLIDVPASLTNGEAVELPE